MLINKKIISKILVPLVLVAPSLGYAAESIGQNLIRMNEEQTRNAYANEYSASLNLPDHDSYFRKGALRLDYFEGIDMAASTTSNSHDDTNAFNNALYFCRNNDLVLYIPEGTVDISDTVSLSGVFMPRAWYPHNLSGTHVRTFNIIGAKYGESIIRLKSTTEGATGFDNPSNPKKMFLVWQPKKSDYQIYYDNGSYSGPIQESMISDEYGEENGSLFSFTLKNVTLDTGNHPGAIALKAVGAQNYLVSDVTIRGENFYCGFYGLPGNAAVVRGLTIDGGRYGIMGYKKTATIDGKVYVTSAAKKNAIFISTLLKNQTEAAIYLMSNRAAQAAASFVGFAIYPPSSTANVIKIDDTTHTGMNHLSLLDGFVKFPDGGAATLAINNRQSSVYMNNVTFYNSDIIIRSENNGDSTVRTLYGDNDYTLVNEYTQVIQIGDPRPPFEGADRNLIAIDNTTDLLFTESKDSEASAPTDNFLTLHFNGRTAPHIDDPDYINVCDLDGDGIYYESGGAVSPNNFGHDEVDPRDGDIATDNATIQAILNNAAKVFLPKGVYYLKNGLRMNTNSTLFGIDNSYTLIVQSSDWLNVGSNGTSDYMIDTASNANGKAYLADLYLLMDYKASKAGKLGYVRWRQGAFSTISGVNSTTFQLGGSNAAKKVHSWSFTGNCGGKVYGLDRVSSMPNINNSYKTHIENSNNLHIYGISIESAVGPNAQAYINNSNHVYIYSAKAEEGTPASSSNNAFPNTIHIENSNDIGVFGFGGKDVFEEYGAKISFTNIDRLTFANISKNFNKVETGSTNTTDEPFHFYLINNQSAGGTSILIDQTYTSTNGEIDDSVPGFRWPSYMIPLYRKGNLLRLKPEASYGNTENVYNLLQFHNTKSAEKGEYNLKSGSYFPTSEGSITMLIRCDNWSIGESNIFNVPTSPANNFIVVDRLISQPAGSDKLRVQFIKDRASMAQCTLTVKDETIDLANIWIQVVATWQAGEQKIYFSYQSDSEQIYYPLGGNGFNAGTDPNWTYSSIQNVVLECAPNDGNISIRNLKIFPAALNTSEIAELYAADNPDLWNGI